MTCRLEYASPSCVTHRDAPPAIGDEWRPWKEWVCTDCRPRIAEAHAHAEAKRRALKGAYYCAQGCGAKVYKAGGTCKTCIVETRREPDRRGYGAAWRSGWSR